MSAARTQVYFTAEQRRRLDAIAERDDKSLAQVVRDAVDAYLDDRPSGAAVNDALDHVRGALREVEVPDRAEWAQRTDRTRL